MSTRCKKCGSPKATRYRCRTCKKVYDTARRVRDFDVMSKQKRDWVAANSTHTKKYKNTWYANNKDRMREKSYTKRYGITLQEYEMLFKKQGGVCAVCLKSETLITYGKVALLSVDHCHTTGKVRGLLCKGCNTGLGHFKDDTDLLESAIDYLRTK